MDEQEQHKRLKKQIIVVCALTLVFICVMVGIYLYDLNTGKVVEFSEKIYPIFVRQ